MQKILDENFYDLIIDNILAPSYDTGDNITYLNERDSLLHIATMDGQPCDLGTQPYHRFPSILTLTSIASLEKSGIIKVQRNPYLSLYGRGVIIGIIDTGIDYQHPAFRYNDNTSRILSIWDQTIQEGEAPERFTFGSEYNKETINLALKSQNPLTVVPSVDTNGHGTSISSIIAGAPNTQYAFSGIVPEAELVVVKLKEAKQNLRRIHFVPEDATCYQESDVILGIRYVLSIAQKLRRPLAICIALGTSQGGHDGQGALSTYIDSLAQLSQIGIAVSAGNEGNTDRHYFHNSTSSPYTTEFELNVGNNDKLFSMEIWPYAPSRLTIEVITPTGESTPIIYPRLGICNRFSFVFNQSAIWINNINFEEETGDQLILIRFENAVPGIWQFRVQNLENEDFSFHAWLPSGNLITRETFFLEPNPDTTITSPGNAIHPLTVTAYNHINDSILIESSRGYTRTNQIKPDIAAPGFEIPCAVPNNKYAVLTGTGAAAAHSTGIIAMILEWAVVRGNYTSITGNDINRLIIRGAYRDPTLTYPNNIWGYGRVDVNGLFERLTIF